MIERRNAVRAVVGGCSDAEDARLLLDILGLSVEDVRAARTKTQDAA